MMVALLLYGYATGRRSSRALERACSEDVAVRVVAANQRPDHTTIARFRHRHEQALAELLGQVLALCADAGLATVALLAVDGTKLHADASQHRNADYEALAKGDPRRGRRARPPSASASAAAMSFRRSSRPARAAVPDCAMPSADSTSSARRKPSRSLPRAPSGCARPSAGSRRTTPPTARRTPTTRPTAHAG
jgi:hypothetical protein